MGLVIVLAATVLLGVAYFLFSKSTKAIGPSNTTLFYYMFGFVFAVIIWIALGHRQSFSKSNLMQLRLLSCFRYDLFQPARFLLYLPYGLSSKCVASA